MQSSLMGRNGANFTGENNPNHRHGLSYGGKRHAIYTAWDNMRSRCLNTNDEKYHRYGGRGITICPEWSSLIAFRDWAFAKGWEPGLTLDRRDNDGNYEPSNCQWLSKGANSRKKSTTKLTYAKSRRIFERAAAGENEMALAAEYGVCHGTVWFIVHRMTWKAENP